MGDTTPDWVKAVLECDARIEKSRYQQSQLADERARIIAKAVVEYGRGSGRDRAAAELGVNVLQIDKAIKRARTSPLPSALPYDLLDRLYALELTSLPPLPAHLWQALAHLIGGTFIDATWIEQPGQLLAWEVEDAAGEVLDEDDTNTLANAARSWTRLQAHAVLDAIGRRDLSQLPADDPTPTGDPAS